MRKPGKKGGFLVVLSPSVGATKGLLWGLRFAFLVLCLIGCIWFYLATNVPNKMKEYATGWRYLAILQSRELSTLFVVVIKWVIFANKTFCLWTLKILFV